MVTKIACRAERVNAKRLMRKGLQFLSIYLTIYLIFIFAWVFFYILRSLPFENQVQFMHGRQNILLIYRTQYCQSGKWRQKNSSSSFYLDHSSSLLFPWVFFLFRSLQFENQVKFAHGIILNPDQSTEMGWGKDLISCTLEFVARLRDIDIDATEFCILNAVVLTYPGKSEIWLKVNDRRSIQYYN